MWLLVVGLIDNVCPVHASSAFLCAIIQSNVPSRCTTAKEVIGDFVEMSALIGEADVIWDCELLGQYPEEATTAYFLIEEWDTEHSSSKWF